MVMAGYHHDQSADDKKQIYAGETEVIKNAQKIGAFNSLLKSQRNVMQHDQQGCDRAGGLNTVKCAGGGRPFPLRQAA